MRLWRRIVSVLAGTMIAASGVLAVAAVVETSGPPEGPAGEAPAAFDVASARTATQQDAQAFAAWLEGVRTADRPTHEERTNAALGAGALAELSGDSSPGNLSTATSPPTTGRALNEDFDADASAAQDGALEVVASNNSTPANAYATDPERIVTPVVDLLDSVRSTDNATVATMTGALAFRASSVLDAPRTTTDAEAAAEPTDVLGYWASTSDIPAPVANWTASADAEILARFDSGALEQDTLNLSLASQAMRDTAPASSDAINAELRFRQEADGSSGSVRETAEAARALAQGGAADRAAAVEALNWLDRQGPLPPELAVYRLRAHAFDGLLLSMPDVRAAPGPTAPAQSAMGGSLFGGASISGKGALAAWLLVGGIGLSLSLVTVDALKGARQRLYDTIRASPGLHVNELRRRLHMSPSSIEYHLAVLVGAGLVVAEDDGRYKRFYANGAGLGLNPRSPNSRNTLGALRRPHAVTLVRALIATQNGATARELSRALLIHESAAARRLSHLEKAGVLVSERRGRGRIFRVSDRLAAMRALTAVEEAPPVVASAPAEVGGTPSAQTQPASAAAPSH